MTKSGNKKVKYEAFEWTWARDKTFKDLKRAFTIAPMLAHYTLSLKMWVETDASNFITAEVLSQMHDGGMLKPVAYFSRKMIFPKCNYMIYNKKLPPVIKNFET